MKYLLLGLLLLAACTTTENPGDPGTTPVEPVACPEDAKICPDGETVVLRGGKNCLFPACPNYKPDTTCEVDSDCVAATCCHPSTVVNKEDAPNCAAVLCSNSCDGPLDCGVGKPVCNAGQCAIQANTNNFNPDELTYVSNDLNLCATIRFGCEEGLIPFNDGRGCGCEPDTSGIGFGTVCEPEQRGATACTLDYTPVCGWYGPEIQCLTYPCAQTFSNACGACSDSKVAYHTPGACPSA